MLKVSFKDDRMKVQTFNERATIVTMVGHMSMPTELWAVFPDKIANWMWQHPTIDASWGKCTKENEVIRLEFSGKAVCSEEDTFNAETGRRIAESRAKLRLYKFMFQLCNKLIKNCLRTIYGKNKIGIEIIEDSEVECLSNAWEKYRELSVKESHHLGKLLEEA